MRNKPNPRASSRADNFFHRGVHDCHDGSESLTVEFNRIVAQQKDVERRLADEFLTYEVSRNARRYGTILNAIARRAYSRRFGRGMDRLDLRVGAYTDIIYELQYLLKDENMYTRDTVMNAIASLCRHKKLHRSFTRAYRAETPEELFQIVKDSLDHMPKQVVRDMVIPQLVAKKLEG